jgi:sigma-B regulation protein RsbU (phosphoserine phosphatase)
MPLKLIVAVCLPVLVIYLLVLALEHHSNQRDAIAQLKIYLTEAAAKEAVSLDSQLSSIAGAGRSAGLFLETLPRRGKAELELLARGNLTAEPRLFGMGVALEPSARPGEPREPSPYVCRTADGRGVRSEDINNAAYDFTRADWYLRPKLMRRPVWTDPYYDDGLGGILMCSYGVPLLRGKDFDGVVVADISLERIRRQLSRVKYPGEYRFLISRSGTFVYHPNSSFIMAETIFGLAESRNRPALAELGRAMVSGQQGVVRMPDFQTGQPKWYAYANVPEVGWSLAAVIPEEEALAPVYARLQRELYLMMIGLALMLSLVVLVSTWITRPMRRLAAAAEQVAKGNLNVRVEEIRSHDEVGRFAFTFNKMVADIRTNVAAKIREIAARQAIEKELHVARQIQSSLMPMRRPPFPDRHEFSLHGDYEPAHYMAGDFFDFRFVDDERLALVIADVSGKGVAAAMFMAVTCTTLRNFSTPDHSPAQVLDIANRLIAAENKEMMFVTVFYAHYHIRTGELEFANAGHNPPFIVRQDGRIECLKPSTGPMLGVFPDIPYGSGRAALQPGDLLLMYTDGVTEAQDTSGQFYGETGLTSLLQRTQMQPVDEICRKIFDEVNEHRHHEGQDDVTLVALRRSSDPAPIG